MHNLWRLAVTFLGRCRNKGIKLRPDPPYICLHETRQLFMSLQDECLFALRRAEGWHINRACTPRYETIQFQDRRGTTSLRQGHRSEITVFMCEHAMPYPIPIWSGFAGARAIWSVVQTLQKSVTKENKQSNNNLTKKTLKSKVG